MHQTSGRWLLFQTVIRGYISTGFKKIALHPPAEDNILLDSFDIAIDELGGIFIANHLIIEFAPELTPAQRDTFRRDSFGILEYKTCICNEDLELWIFDDTYTDIIEKKKKAEASGCVEEIGNDYFVYDDLLNSGDTVVKAFEAVPQGVSLSEPNDQLIIVVPDSGVKFSALSDEELAYIYATQGITCGDTIWGGWNFIDSLNNPYDDHFASHGTRVIQKLISSLKLTGMSASSVKILPLKTHAAEGHGNLFDVTCALYYGMNAEAAVINASWGYYGEESDVLRTAIDSMAKKDILLVAGAGNDSLKIDSLPFFPAAFAKKNVWTATSLDGNNQIAGFANFSKVHVDVGYEAMDGTSFAAPVFTAAISKGLEEFPDASGVQTIVNNVLDCASQSRDLIGYIKEGRILQLDIPCDPPPTGWLSWFFCLLVLLLIIWFVLRLIANRQQNP